MIILRGVNVFPTQIEEVLLATDWCGGHFIIELTREGRMDEMTVIAEARPESWDGSGLVNHADRISALIKNTIGITSGVGRRRRHAGAFARKGQAGLRQAAEGLAFLLMVRRRVSAVSTYVAPLLRQAGFDLGRG